MYGEEVNDGKKIQKKERNMNRKRKGITWRMSRAIAKDGREKQEKIIEKEM